MASSSSERIQQKSSSRGGKFTSFRASSSSYEPRNFEKQRKEFKYARGGNRTSYGTNKHYQYPKTRSDHTPYITESKSDLINFRRGLAEHILNNFHFRVVENVYVEKPPPITMGVPSGQTAEGVTCFVEIPVRVEYVPIVLQRSFEGLKELIEPEEIDALDDEAFDKNVVVIPWSFTGITCNTDTIFRTRLSHVQGYHPSMEDPYEGHPVIFSSSNRCEFNPYTFTFDEIAKDHHPLAGDGVRMPEVGDVIAYFPTSESLMEAYIDRTEQEDLAGKSEYAPKPIQADAWFICSFQLLRMMAMIAFGPTHSLLKAGTKGKYSIARYWLFQSNRLRTNKLLERYFAYGDSGVQFDPKLPEISSLYTCSRMESTYLNWVHLYAAIVLMISYGIVPSDNNVPKTLDQDGNICKINMKHWHIPDGYVQDFIQRWMTN